MAKRRARLDHAVPIILPTSVRAELGDDADALLAALKEPSPVSVRLNPAKPSRVIGARIPWCESGRYLSERPVFTLDPLLHAGCYYVQEASSMLLEQAVEQSGLRERDVLALDLCAAPGGKSTHLASLLTPGSMLVCNETVRARQGALMENVWKHGRANTMITGSAPVEFDALGEFFDLVVVDAPCSGEGMFRKDPFARQQWNERLVTTCARTQSDILPHAWNMLKPGGVLIYCTCTWERSENEVQVERLIGQGGGSVPLKLDPSWGVISTDAGYCCYPHRVKGEGFFIAMVRKAGEMRSERTPTTITREEQPEPMAWSRDREERYAIEVEDTIHAVPLHWRHVINGMREHLRVLAPGIPIAQCKGLAWRPHAALALNEILRPDAFLPRELEHEQALDWLRGGTMNERNAQGVRLMRYEGHPLGWSFAAGDRWNNGWPKSWRIRMR